MSYMRSFFANRQRFLQSFSDTTASQRFLQRVRLPSLGQVQAGNAVEKANLSGRFACLALGLLYALGLLFVGCQKNDTPPLLPLDATTTVVAQSTPLPTDHDASGVITNNERQLVIWAPEFFHPSAEVTPLAVLENVYEQFRYNHPGVHLDIQTKAETGDASLLNYLRYAQSMAPTILPDLVLLNTEQLWQIADLGLVQPVDWRKLTHTTDFFQFARDAVSYQEKTIGIPYAADVIHLVYHADQLTQAPTTWEKVIATGTPYFFPAAKQDYSNESLLLQYVGAGGQLFEDGSIINPDALTAMFTFMAEAKGKGILSEKILEINSLEGTWSTFETDTTGIANASARMVLAKQETVANLGFAQIPTLNGATTTIAHTWAFALITSDAEQQKLALEFVDQLLDPVVHSAWSHANHQLPTQITAYTTWGDSSPYYEFLQRQLDVAIAIPNGRRFVDFTKRLQQAQELLLLNQLNIEDAVRFVQTTP